jgi:hypothetical protein
MLATFEEIRETKMILGIEGSFATMPADGADNSSEYPVYVTM